MKYFVDTYAFMEIIKGNSHYLRYVEEELFTSIFNLFELYYNLLEDFGQEVAQKYFYEFYDLVLPLNDSDIFLASTIKLKYKKMHISYTDALGYAISLQQQMKFLTGDKEFEHLENVEFVK